MKLKTLVLTAWLGALTACGGRPDTFDAPVALPPTTHGLTGSVAVVDGPLNRVVLLTATGSFDLESTVVPVGKNVVATAMSPDRDTLYVLSNGIRPRRNPEDELPSLSVIDGGLRPELTRRVELSDPLGGLAVDPLGEWVVVFDAGGVVVNPNELILIRVDDPNSEPITKTIRSFGGRPERLTFTTELNVPNGPPRRMLIVETDRDVHLLDLAFVAERDPITVQLPRTSSGQPASPGSVAFHDGAPDDPTDARIAIRLENDADVVLLELGPPPANDPDRDFKITINESDVVGPPSAIDFVVTDGGLRLAALVPERSLAVLIDPTTGVTEQVELPGPYRQISRVTDDVADRPESSDVALLWDGGPGAGIAFWQLGRTSGQPFRSVEASQTDIPIARVLDVPGEALAHRKVLEGSGASQFFVLDLDQRTTFPMLTPSSNGFRVTVSPDGLRAVAVSSGSPELGTVDLATLHPTSLQVEVPVTAAFDVERRDGGRSLVALHARGSLAATVMDFTANEPPDTARTSFHAGLLLGGLRESAKQEKESR